MSRNRKFADKAGYTSHCWDCCNSSGWTKVRSMDKYLGICTEYEIAVGKFDSPNNGCSRARYCTRYNITHENEVVDE